MRSSLRALVLLTTLTAGLAAAAPAWAQLGLNEGPLIRFLKREHDFGQVPQNEHVRATFLFENAGTETLRIENLESSCGCTAVAPRDREVAPGDTSGIEVVFHSRDYRGDKSQVVAVYTNDPAEPRIDLVVHAFVKPSIEIQDEWIDFGEVPVGTTPAASTIVSADPGTGFEILGFEGRDDLVEWNVVPASVAGGIAYRVEARIRPEAPIGKFSERLLMKVRHADRTEERIGIRGHIRSYFLVEDRRLNFHNVQKGREVTRSLEIGCSPDRAHRIASVVVHAPYFRTELVETDTGYRLDVILDSGRVDADEARFRFRDYAILETTDPREPEIVIELSGVVRR